MAIGDPGSIRTPWPQPAFPYVGGYKESHWRVIWTILGYNPDMLLILVLMMIAEPYDKHHWELVRCSFRSGYEMHTLWWSNMAGQPWNQMEVFSLENDRTECWSDFVWFYDAVCKLEVMALLSEWISVSLNMLMCRNLISFEDIRHQLSESGWIISRFVFDARSTIIEPDGWKNIITYACVMQFNVIWCNVMQCNVT